MAVQLEILSSEIREFHPEATDEAIGVAIAASETAVGAEVWAARASLIQHVVVIVQHLLSTVPADLVAALTSNDHVALAAAVDALVGDALTDDVKTYLKARTALYIEADTPEAVHN